METIQNQIEKLENELAKLKDIVNKPKSYKRWRAEEGESYYYINGEVSIYIERHDDMDDGLYNIGNYYQTREEAQKALDKQLAIIKVNDRIRELNEGWELDWNKNEYKYNIYYDCTECKFDTVVTITNNYNPCLLYINEEELGEQIIKEMTPELNIIFDIK